MPVHEIHQNSMDRAANHQRYRHRNETLASTASAHATAAHQIHPRQAKKDVSESRFCDGHHDSQFPKFPMQVPIPQWIHREQDATATTTEVHPKSHHLLIQQNPSRPAASTDRCSKADDTSPTHGHQINIPLQRLQHHNRHVYSHPQRIQHQMKHHRH